MTATSEPTSQHMEVPFTHQSSCLLKTPVSPQEDHPPLVVALHGQGESGERHCRWIEDALPPHVALACPDGFYPLEVRRQGKPHRLGYGWYLFTGDQEAFEESLAQSEEALWRVIDEAVSRLDADPEKVILSGFSQGGYLTHFAAVRAADRLAGWVGQSCRLKDEILAPWLPSVVGKPVLIQHGLEDASLPPEAAERSERALSQHKAIVTLRLYENAGHLISDEMRQDMAAWIDATLGETSVTGEMEE